MAWAKLATKTLTGTSDTIQPDAVFTSKTFNQVLVHNMSSGVTEPTLRLGSTSIDTGSNYARRMSGNGGADSTSTSVTRYSLPTQTGNWPMFTVIYLVNISTQEKLFISFNIEQNSSGSGSAPHRGEGVGKWSNTSNQFDITNITNLGPGDFDTDSNLTILGTD